MSVQIVPPDPHLMKLIYSSFDQAGHAIYITDPSGTIFYVNRAFSEVTGFQPHEALGQNPRILKSGKMPQEYYISLWASLYEGNSWDEDITNRKKSGEIYCAHQTIAPVLDESQHIMAFIAIQTDISERKALERKLSESESRYRAILSAMKEGYILMDKEGKIIHSNPAAEAILGRDARQMTGLTAQNHDWGAIYEDGSPFPAELHPASRTLATGVPFDAVTMGLKFPNGSVRWISINSRAINFSGDEKPSSVLTTFTDITKDREELSEMKKLSETDYLTDLLNRRAMAKALEGEYSRARRHNFPLSILMLDLDHFKSVNDRFGHDIGDLVLKFTSRSIKFSLRAGDLLGRWGGEEFLLLAPHTGTTQAAVLAQRILNLVRELKEPLPLPVTLSIGYASTEDEPGATVARLIEMADEALYRAKAGGRNRAEGFQL